MSKHLAHLLIIIVVVVSFNSESAATSRPDSADITLKIARRGHTSSILADGRVVIIGGENQSGAVCEVEIIDPDAQTVRITKPLRIARFRHTATLLNDGRVLVAGGWNGKEIFDSTEIFDPVTQSVSPGPRLTRPRAAHNAIALADGRVLITGGSDDASAEVFDPKTQTFTVLKSWMSTARSFHASIVLQDGNVMLVGGVDEEGRRLDSAELFDTKTLSFSNTAGASNIRRVLPTLRLLPDGKVQLIGGDYDGTMELYDPDRKVFSAPAHLAPTSDIFPTGILRTSTRAAFIDLREASSRKFSRKTRRATVLAHASSANSLLLDRVDYSAAEINNFDMAVMSGGLDSKGRYLRSVFLLNSSPASVTMNKTEYSPEERHVISGSGWKPGETISIVRQEARSSHRRTYINAVADSQGNFINTEISAKDFHEGVTYTMTVMGKSSGRVAQTVYKDAESADPARQQKPKFNVPLLPRDVSYELEDGILIFQYVAGDTNRVKPPALPALDDEEDNVWLQPRSDRESALPRGRQFLSDAVLRVSRWHRHPNQAGQSDLNRCRSDCRRRCFVGSSQDRRIRGS